MKIKIRCEGTRTVDINDLVDFQGKLKELSVEDARRLQSLIEKHGFIFPVFVWKSKNIDYFIDGHQRIAVVRQMINNGWTIGPIPVVDIQAKSHREAKELILAQNSKFGKITEDGLYEYIEGNEINYEDVKELFDFPEIKMHHFEKNFYSSDPEKEPGTEHVEFEAKKEKVCPECGAVIK